MYNNITDGYIGFQKWLKLGKRFINVDVRRIFICGESYATVVNHVLIGPCDFHDAGNVDGFAESSHKNGI